MTIADKKFLGALLLHCADLSNCCQPWALSDKWAQRVHKEFSAQAANEQRRGLPVVQFMLSATDEQWARTECDFIDYVAAPLWNNTYAFMMRHYEKQHYMTMLKATHEYLDCPSVHVRRCTSIVSLNPLVLKKLPIE